MDFFTILAILFVLVLYSLICFYIGYNGWVWLKTTRLAKFKKSFITVVVFFSVSIFVGQFAPFEVIEMVSSIWMAVLAFSLLFLPVINLVVFLQKKKVIFGIGIVSLSLFMIFYAYGSYNAWNPVVRTYDIEIEKKSELKGLKIVMASDFHLGTTVGVNHLERFVKIVATEKPDLVMLPGDIINDHIHPFLKNNMGDKLKEIEAPLGVYATLGNHDYYGGDAQKVLEELRKNGITVLMDEYINVDQLFYMVGRKDHTDDTRKKIEEFMNDVEHSKPIFMMDHQPSDIDEAMESGVDVLVSGHTHGGQIAPANLITDKLFENDWGYLQKGTLHSLVSSGFGTWGPALRIGTRSEVMVINVSFGS